MTEPNLTEQVLVEFKVKVQNYSLKRLGEILTNTVLRNTIIDPNDKTNAKGGGGCCEEIEEDDGRFTKEERGGSEKWGHHSDHKKDDDEKDDENITV